MTDTDFLAAALEDGKWHSHTEILNRSITLRGCGLTIHSRAADLRKRGHVVETRLERDGRGRTLSYYRLLGEADGAGLSASPSTSSIPAVQGDPPLSPAPRAESTQDRGGGVLLLFDEHDQAFVCTIDESAGLRGAA